MTTQPKQRSPRKALTQHRTPAQQPVHWQGERETASILAKAWELARSQPYDTLTHGFHTYPARMHPAIAAHLLDAWRQDRIVRPNAPPPSVLDPFCGSGTVLVECVVRHIPCAGIDLNPLATRLSALKSSIRSRHDIARFLARAKAVTDASLEHVRARDDIRAPLPKSEVTWYAPHVLKELGGLWHEIGQTSDAQDKEALTLVFSALVVKFSTQQADTSENQVVKRIRKGLVSEFFLRKSQELAERWQALATTVAHTRARRDPEPPILLSGDTRRAERLFRHQRFDLILSSPPYGGTYDYVQHQARRYAWLGIDPTRFDEQEIGSRRHLMQEHAEERWHHQLGETLTALRAVSTDQTSMVLLMGDGKIGGRMVPASEQLQALAPDCGWKWVATASEDRQDWHGNHISRHRREHLVCLRATS